MSKNIYRPSCMKRMLGCNGSVKLCADIPSLSDHHADNGSCCHLLLEECLISRRRADDCDVGRFLEVTEDDTEDVRAIEVVPEMVDAVNCFLEYCFGGLEATDPLDWSGDWYPEKSLKHTTIEGFGGTIDFLEVYHDRRHTDITDLKYGTGMVYPAPKGIVNPQLMSYASIANCHYPFETATLTIVQPRATTKAKARSVDVTIEEVLAFEARVAKLAGVQSQITPYNIENYLKEGSYCYFCEARRSCPVKNQSQHSKDYD